MYVCTQTDRIVLSTDIYDACRMALYLSEHYRNNIYMNFVPTALDTP